MRSSLLLLALLGCTDQALTRFNAEPEASILSPSTADTVIEGQTLALRGQVSDDDDGAPELSATWYAGDQVLCEGAAPDDEGLTTCTWVADTSGASLRLDVIDPEGQAGSDTVQLEVTPNSAPTAAFVLPTETGRYYDGSLVEFDGLAADAEEAVTALAVAFSSSIDGALELAAAPEADGHARGATLLSQGEHYLTMTVADGYGKSSTDTVIISVGPPNNAPTCAITAPSEGDIGRERDELLLAGTAYDADVSADQLAAEWSSDRDGVLGAVTPTSGGAVLLATTSLSAGTHVLTLTIADDASATCVASVTYAVRGAPIVAIDAPLDGDVLLDSAIAAISGTATDLEDLSTDLLVEWSSDVDGLLFADSPDSDGSTAFTSDTLTPGVHELTLQATDTDGQGSATSISVTVDAVPTAPEVSLGPVDARTDDDLAVAIVTPSSDAEGDPITYSYAWYVNGVASTASTTSTLPASATSRDETWTVEVTPNDGYGPGPSGSASLVVANTAPELSAVAIDNSAPLTNDVLGLTSTSADADADTVSLDVEWYVGGSKVGTRTTLDGAVAFAKGEEIYAIVTPTDGSNSGAAVRTASVTVGNTAPGTATVVLEPTDPAEGVDDLVCTVAAADADDDTLAWTFEWTVDGLATTASETTYQAGDTVLAEVTVAGEVWACVATPDDGSASGTSGTDDVTITECMYGQAGACPGVSCDDILTAGFSSGDGRYWIDPDAAGAIEVQCDMTTDGGGWTLVAVSSDDGADTWTYTRRRYWDLDTTTFGSLSALEQDFKSEALHRSPVTDVLLTHAPSGIWAAYAGVGTASLTLAGEIAAYGDESCWRDDDGFPMTAGGISATGDLCNTDLYFNAADKDGGGSCSCSNCTEDAHGPTYSVNAGEGCGLDDPGASGSLGPSSGDSTEDTALGFGDALGLNTGAPAAAENYVQVWVR